MRARRLLLAGVMSVASIARVAAQTPSRSFEVSSVKENTSRSDAGGFARPTPGRFSLTNVPLRFIILYAYELMGHQLIGAPEWTETTGYDIAATYPADPVASDQELRQMAQRLLEDRFGLKMHRESRELPMYALVRARKDELGPQLVRSDVDCEKWIADKRPQTDAGGPSKVTPSGKRPACMMIGTRRFLTGGTRTMAQLAGYLQSLTERPVVDRTSLTGAFDIDLQWTSGPSIPPAGGNAAVDNGPSIFTAIQEQLGLRLDSTRGPFDVMVIDAVQRPAPD